MSTDELRDKLAEELARNWNRLHTNESLGFQRMLADALLPIIDAHVAEMLGSEASVEAVAKALFAIEEPDLNAWRWGKPNPRDPSGPFAWHEYWLGAAQQAIAAASRIVRGRA